MGVMRFIVPDMQRVTDPFLAHTYIASIEGVPWRSHTERTEDGFSLRRQVDESGNLFTLWRMPDGGELMLSTASLMVRQRPYLLPVELARGTLNRMRNQTEVWAQAGLKITPQLWESLRAATRPFAQAATLQDDDPQAACQAAEEAIRLGLQASDALLEEYVGQVLPMRHEGNEKLSVLLGIGVDSVQRASQADKLLKGAFNLGSVPTCWENIEPITSDFDWEETDRLIQWPHRHGMKVMAGPLLSFNSAWLPDWLVLWEDDFPTVQSYVETFVRETVQRYRGKVHVWHCAARLNSGRVLSLTDEQRLKLSVVALEEIRRHDPRTPVIISFDQPWAEYMAHAKTDVAPSHFADALARANLGLSGLGLEINWGYEPGTTPRDPIELSRLLDNWSVLGLPLVVLLRVPSHVDDQPAGRNKLQTRPGTHSATWDESQHGRLVRQLVSTCLCKQSVQAIVWNQAFDGPHGLPHAGLVAADGKPKPAFEAIAEIRQQHVV